MIVLPGDSKLGGLTIRGRVLGRAPSKSPGGCAYSVQPDVLTQELIRVFVADPTAILVDLEDMPEDRLPGMEGYKGGAFVELYGKMSSGERMEFVRHLGSAEAVADESQGLLSTPRAAYEAGATEMVEYASAVYGIELRLGLAWISEAAEVMAKMAPPEGYSPLHMARAIFLWGAYLGECLIHDFGGSWTEDAKLGEVVLVRRQNLPPVAVSPFKVAEVTIRDRTAAHVAQWVRHVSNSVQSTEFSLPAIL